MENIIEVCNDKSVSFTNKAGLFMKSLSIQTKCNKTLSQSGGERLALVYSCVEKFKARARPNIK